MQTSYIKNGEGGEKWDAPTWGVSCARQIIRSQTRVHWFNLFWRIATYVQSEDTVQRKRHGVKLVYSESLVPRQREFVLDRNLCNRWFAMWLSKQNRCGFWYKMSVIVYMTAQRKEDQRRSCLPSDRTM